MDPEDERLRGLVSGLQDEASFDVAVESSLRHIRQQSRSRGERAHSYLCTAALRGATVTGGREEKCGALLRCLGPSQTLLVAYRSTNGAR